MKYELRITKYELRNCRDELREREADSGKRIFSLLPFSNKSRDARFCVSRKIIISVKTASKNSRDARFCVSREPIFSALPFSKKGRDARFCVSRESIFFVLPFSKNVETQDFASRGFSVFLHPKLNLHKLVVETQICVSTMERLFALKYIRHCFKEILISPGIPRWVFSYIL